MKRYPPAGFMLLLLWFISGCTAAPAEVHLQEVASVIAASVSTTTDSTPEHKLACRNIDGEAFSYAQSKAKTYEIASTAKAGVVPHHLTAAPMIGGYFLSLAESGALYDTVVIIGPNHAGDQGEVIVSARDWDFGEGVACDADMIGKIKDIQLADGSIAINDRRMEQDHSVSSMIPFIHHSWPAARVAPVLVSRSLSYGDTLRFSESLSDIIANTEGRVLLLCTIDFSHYLKPAEATLCDSITLEAIEKKDYPAIHHFTNVNLDSPAALIIYLQYLSEQGLSPVVVDHADASHFLGASLQETTSYLILSAQ